MHSGPSQLYVAVYAVCTTLRTKNTARFKTIHIMTVISYMHIHVYFREKILTEAGNKQLHYLIAMVDMLATCAEVNVQS